MATKFTMLIRNKTVHYQSLLQASRQGQYSGGNPLSHKQTKIWNQCQLGAICQLSSICQVLFVNGAICQLNKRAISQPVAIVS
jgi:hypothetical protein